MEKIRIDAPIMELNEIKDAFQLNAKSKLREILKESGVDYDENQRLVKWHEHCVEDAKDIRDNIALLQLRLVLFIIIGLALATGGVAGIVGAVRGVLELEYWDWPVWEIILFLLFVFVMSIVLFYLAYRTVRYITKGIIPLLSDKNEIKKELDKKLCEAEGQCWDNIRPFLSMLHEFFQIDVMNETIEGVCLKHYLDSQTDKEMEQRVSNVFKHDLNETTLELISGSMYQNPFVVRKYRKHYMSSTTYSGSTTVYIDDWETDSKGNRVKTKKKETLEASITRPVPAYADDNELLYTSDNAPDVSFTHGLSIMPKMARSIVIESKGRDSVMWNKSQFTPMTNNPEFETLFYAIDRDNELQFRELFTPKAQVNIVDIMKSSEYGDYFTMEKKKRLTRIRVKSKMLKPFSWEMWGNLTRYQNFDLKKVGQMVLEDSQAFIDKYLMMFMPILAVPYYQEDAERCKDYFSDSERKMNYSEQQAEALANCMNPSVFAGRNTKVMITAKFLEAKGKTDTYVLDIKYFDEYPRTETVNKEASDGSTYAVNIDWTEYVERRAGSYMMVKDTGKARVVNSLPVESQNCICKQGLFAYVSGKTFDYDSFERKVAEELGK